MVTWWWSCRSASVVGYFFRGELSPFPFFNDDEWITCAVTWERRPGVFRFPCEALGWQECTGRWSVALLLLQIILVAKYEVKKTVESTLFTISYNFGDRDVTFKKDGAWGKLMWPNMWEKRAGRYKINTKYQHHSKMNVPQSRFYCLQQKDTRSLFITKKSYLERCWW